MATVSAAAPRVPSLREWGRILAHRAGQSIPGKTRVARTLLLEFASFAGPRRISLTAVLILAGTAVEGVGIQQNGAQHRRFCIELVRRDATDAGDEHLTFGRSVHASIPA